MKKIIRSILLFLMLPGFQGIVRGQAIALTKPVYTYFQNFDSLASSGTSSKLPYGWYMYEAGAAGNTTYTADSGASSTGDTYSYGHKGSTDRALGSLATNSEQSSIGAQFVNKTGYSVNSITVSYTVEQWRLGATGRADSMPASVTTYASNLNFGFWVSMPVLSIKSPVTSGTTGQLDGNASSNRKKFSYTISGIAVSNGSSIWIRWQDQNISGANDGLAIDDFSLSVKAYIPHTIRSSKFPQTSGIPDTTLTGLWKGIVLGQNYINGGLYFQFKDSTGNITAISKSKTFGYTPSAGDSVAVYGKIQSANYLTYINVDSVGLINSGFSAGFPTVVTNINSDTLESGLVEIKNMKLASGYKWDTTGGHKNAGFMTTMTNGTNTYNVWISNTSDLYYGIAPKFPFNLIGIVLQNSSSATSGYYIWPRSKADIDTMPLPVYKISQVRPQNTITGIADSANTGHLLFLKGVVQSPGFLKSGLEFSVFDNTGSIMAVSSTINNYSPSEGDSVLIRGTITQVDGMTEINADSIRTLPRGSAAFPAPLIVANLAETDEAKLVKFKKAYIVDSTKWLPAGTDFTVKYTDGTDTIDVRIFNNTDLFKMKSAPKGKFNITGICGQLKTSSPYLGGYQLYPRGITDYEKILPFAPVPLYKISRLKGYSASTGVADSLNKGKGFIKGVVHSQSFSSTALQFSLIDNTGAITIFSGNIKYYTPAIGDSLLVSGTVSQVNGLTEYTADSIITLTKGSWLKTPTVVTALGENTESDLVKINNVYLVDSTQWKAAGTGFTVQITDGSNTYNMLINSTIDLFKMKPYKGHFNVTGIASQDDPTSPYLSNYLIQPRGLYDIQHVLQLYKIRDVRVQNAVTGIADSAGSKNAFYLKGIVQSPNYALAWYSFSIKDSTGSIFIVSGSLLNNYTPVTGDSVFVRGLLTQSYGRTEVLIDSITRLKNASPVLIPTVVTVLNESNEAKLVKFNNMWILDGGNWFTSIQGGFTATITNGKDTVELAVSQATKDLYNSYAPRGKFNITGIVSQTTTSSGTYLGGYYLLPRSLADINYLPYHLYNIGSVKKYNSITGIADSINTYCLLKGIALCESLSGSPSDYPFSLAMKDSTGAITVSGGASPKVGDSIEIRGFIKQFSGLTIMVADSGDTLHSAAANVAPSVVTNFDESNESFLVKRLDYYIPDTITWKVGPFPRASGFIAYGNKDTIAGEILTSTDIFKSGRLLPGHYDITGIVSQHDTSKPYFQDYFLIPRSLADFQHSSGIEPENGLENQLTIFPNPATNSINIISGFRMDRICIVDMVGRIVGEQIPGTGSTHMDISSLNPGIYMVMIRSGENTVYKKVVKE